MSKILMVADTHWGVRKDNIHFYNYQKKFVDGVILPFCEKIKPDIIVHLGDVVDNRNYINYRTHDHLMCDYLDVMQSLDIPQYWIVGNHDAFYKNSLKTNAVSKFVSHGIVIDKPMTLNIKGEEFTFIPWICDDNREESVKLLKSSITKYCFGHFEINGFEVRRGTFCDHGFDREVFDNFHTVFSGHFHNRSMSKNVKYIGSCFEFDWSDYGEYRGMCLLDTENDSVKYYKNPNNMFNVLEYDESNIPSLDGIKDTYVKVFVKNKQSESRFNDFVSEIEDMGVIKCNIVEAEEKKFEVVNEIVVDDLRQSCEYIIDSMALSNGREVKELFNKLYDQSSR